MHKLKGENASIVFRKLWRSKFVILFVALAAFFAAMALTQMYYGTTTYRAEAMVTVMYTGADDQTQEANVLKNYADIATSKRVCEETAALIGSRAPRADELQKKISAALSNDSYIMKIYATDEDPLLAAQIANTAANVFVSQVTILSGDGALQVFDFADSAEPVATNRYLVVLILTLIVLVVTCALISVRELTSGRLRVISQCAEDEQEILAIIPQS